MTNTVINHKQGGIMKFNNLPIVIFDIDGTIALTGDRKECLKRTPKNWDEFYARIGEDLLNEPVMEILRGLCRLQKYNFIYLTGRRESCREATMKWLDDNNIILQPEDLIMRAVGDYRSDTIVKPELIKHLLPRIFMAFEDRATMATKWREIGVTCCQVAEGLF